jgi:hypothetical protein
MVFLPSFVCCAIIIKAKGAGGIFYKKDGFSPWEPYRLYPAKSYKLYG